MTAVRRQMTEGSGGSCCHLFASLNPERCTLNPEPRLVHLSDPGGKKQIPGDNQDEYPCGSADGPLDADDVCKHANEEDADHSDSPLHHIHAHDPPTISIFAIGL